MIDGDAERLGDPAGRGNGGLILRHAPRPVRQVGQVEEMIARRIAADHRAHAGEPDAGIDHVAGDADVGPDFGCARVTPIARQ